MRADLAAGRLEDSAFPCRRMAVDARWLWWGKQGGRLR